MLARLAQRVFDFCEADDALTRAILRIVPIRIQPVSLFNREDALGCHNLLLDESDLC